MCKSKLRDFYRKRIQNDLNDYNILWGEDAPEKNNVRYSIFEKINLIADDTVIDMGSGYADLYKYLNEKFLIDKYIGVEVVKEFAEVSKTRYPELCICEDSIFEIDVSEYDADYVCWFGSLNKWWSIGSDLKKNDKIHDYLVSLYGVVNKGIIFNGFSPFADYQKNENIYVDPAMLISKCSSFGISDVLIQFDKPKYEMTIGIFK